MKHIRSEDLMVHWIISSERSSSTDNITYIIYIHREKWASDGIAFRYYFGGSSFIIFG